MSATTTAPRAASRLARLLPMPAGAGLARMLVERGVPVAIGSDINPGG